MKKKSRRPRSSDQTSRTPNTAASSVNEEKRSSGSRGKPRKNIPAVTDAFYHENTQMEKPAEYGKMAEDAHKHGESKFKSSGRLSTATCRLCHGKFSPRSLRHAFNKWPQDSIHIVEDESDAAVQTPVLFHTDFQRLVGVQLDRDPSLSEFICKKCHAKFYKCHSILVRFLQRVNLPPVGKDNSKIRKTAKSAESSINHGSAAPPSFTSDPKCLHSLVSWAHHHGEACRSCPDLKEVLEGQCWGSVKAVWGCVDGHKYIMDARCDTAAGANAEHTLNFSSRVLGSRDGDGSEEEEHNEEEEEDEGNGTTPAGNLIQHSPGPITAQSQSSALNDWTSHVEDFSGYEESRAVVQTEDRMADSELSDRVMSEDDFDKGVLSDDELFEPLPDSKRPRSKGRQSLKTPEEPKTRKKPGPKPGWKNKFKPKGEELPNIYKCPYQGCTAVYRAPDGLKKHIREHHEEVRERPCPHPGCNKVFMIDRYLQRHIKLIHTEERNYICDQCGQTFKQRKHLSVHQMRHSGAKPLQCEVCGFQCRQRASLKYHMTKHKAEADLEFACLICGKRFEKAHNLNVHMSMVHPLTQVEAYRGNSQQQEQQTYTDLHTITLTGEVVQHDQDR